MGGRGVRGMMGDGCTMESRLVAGWVLWQLSHRFQRSLPPQVWLSGRRGGGGGGEEGRVCEYVMTQPALTRAPAGQTLRVLQ